MVRIFVSYSHRDSQYLGDTSLLGFLKGLEREEEVEFWDDRELQGGMLWDDAIKEQLRASDIALVLVSQSFLDSRYCSDVEMASFLARCREEGLILFPVILSPCDWERQEWIASRQFLPESGKTIEEHFTDDGLRKRLFLRIRTELRGAIARARETREARARAKSSEAATLAPTLAPTMERRVVTVLHCELVPTELNGRLVESSELPEIVQELAGEYHAACASVFEQFEGSVARSAGSGVTVYFGHPLVHEDDSRRAVRAGLAVIETLAKVSARIEHELSVRLTVRGGVHSGVAIVPTGHSAAGGNVEMDVMAAMRAGDLAPLNGIVVTEATHELVAPYFESEESATLLLGAGRQSVRTYRVVRDRGLHVRVDADANACRLPQLIGREQEIALLLDRWQTARQGRGQVVMLRAEAGFGKSRLLEELKLRHADDPRHWIECRCSPYHKDSAFYPIIGVLQTRLGLEPSEPDDSRLRKLEEHLGRYGASLPESVPLLASLLSIHFEPKYSLPALPARDLKQRTQEVLVQLLIDQAMEKPVAFVVEDLHWVDPSTQEFLDLLVEQAESLPILLLFTFRPEQIAPPEWLSRAYTSQVTLDRLDREAVRRMTLCTTGGRPLPPEVFEEICARTEGVPLFVEDLTRMVIESELLVLRDGQYELAGPFQSLVIPATLQETLMARLAKLATAKPVAQVGATIGREFVFEMLRDVGGFDNKTLEEELNRLVGAGLLYRRGLLSRAKYIFKHALVQEALQQSLVKKQRRHYHKVIAEVLEEKFAPIAEAQPELVAYHCEEAGMYAQAAPHWQRAAERALGQSANREALNHARRALEALQHLPEGEARDQAELDLRVIAGPALLALKGWAAPELRQCYDRARDICHRLPRTQRLFSVLRGLWTYHMVAAHLEESLTIARELFDMATAAADEDQLLEAHGALCDTMFWLGRPEESLEQARLGFALYDLDRHHLAHSRVYGEDPASMFYSYSALSLALLGRVPESLAATQAAIDVLPRFTHTHSRAFLLCGIAWNYVQLRGVANAAKYAQQLIDDSEQHHFGAWLPIGEAMKGWALAMQGHFADGVAMMTAGRARWHATGAGVKACFYPALLAELHVNAGALEGAAEWLEAGFAAAEACDDRYNLSELYRVRGDLLAARGRDEDALPSYTMARAIAAAQKAQLLEQRAAAGQACLRARQESPDESPQAMSN
jgi:class 3 adenylate cyclase/predicted ATPase